MVAQPQRSNLPVPLENAPAVVDDDPCVTFAINGVVLRIRATQLRSLIQSQLAGFEASYNDDLSGANGAKMKAFQLAVRAAFSTIAPMVRQTVNQIRASEKTPAYLRRMLPEMPPAKRHEDRYIAFQRYIGEIVHAALTQNVWQLDVANEDAATLEVTGFKLVDPDTFLAEQALTQLVSPDDVDWQDEDDSDE